MRSTTNHAQRLITLWISWLLTMLFHVDLGLMPLFHGLPGVNYVGGSRQLRRRVGAPTPLPWQGGGPRFCWGLLAGN